MDRPKNVAIAALALTLVSQSSQSHAQGITTVYGRDGVLSSSVFCSDEHLSISIEASQVVFANANPISGEHIPLIVFQVNFDGTSMENIIGESAGDRSQAILPKYRLDELNHNYDALVSRLVFVDKYFGVFAQAEDGSLLMDTFDADDARELVSAAHGCD